MRVRWIVATVGALALALLTLDSSELWFEGVGAGRRRLRARRTRSRRTSTSR